MESHRLIPEVGASHVVYEHRDGRSTVRLILRVGYLENNPMRGLDWNDVATYAEVQDATHVDAMGVPLWRAAADAPGVHREAIANLWQRLQVFQGVTRRVDALERALPQQATLVPPGSPESLGDLEDAVREARRSEPVPRNVPTDEDLPF